MRLLSFLFCTVFTQVLFAQTVISPNKSISVTVGISDSATAWYSVSYKGKEVLSKGQLGIAVDNLGLATDNDDFSKSLKLLSASASKPTTDQYQMFSAKRKACVYTANKKTYSFINAQGHRLDIVFQVSNDGVAFRYLLPNIEPSLKTVSEEKTTYHFPENTVAGCNP